MEKRFIIRHNEIADEWTLQGVLEDAARKR
jgi:hypothetical protein